MAGVFHVRAKTQWKKVEIPTELLSEANFDDLIEIQELSDYEILQNDRDHVALLLSSPELKQTPPRPIGGERVGSFGAPRCLPTTADTQTTHNMDAWNNLGVPAEVLRALREEGFTSPTPIQALALPSAIRDRLDIVGAAETGSGKTLAFAIPILHFILQQENSETEEDEEEAGPVALILEPTRELALQVKKHIMAAARHTDIKVVTVVGGMAPQKQARLLRRKPEIVVATPGRLWELIEEGEDHLTKISQVRQLVMDEADRMIEKGHFEELTKILSFINSNSSNQRSRQTYVFSATLSLTHSGPQRQIKKKRKKASQNKLDELVERIGMKGKPKVIDLTRKEATVQTLTETRINCRLDEKDLYLYYLLRKYGGRTLVFCNSKDCIRRLVSVFKLLHRDPLPLHADMHQRQRLKNLDKFTEKETSLLLASDVAARGLDIPNVDHVIHYQVPRTIENYVHRSGRTARANKEGISVTLVSPDEVHNYRKIVSELKQGEDLPDFPIQVEMLNNLKPLVALAIDIDKKEHKFKSDKRHNGWLHKAAEEMDIDMDEDLLADVGSSQEQEQLASELNGLKKKLASLIQRPMVQAGFSGRYPTKTGQLVVPKSFTEGSAVQEARGVKRKLKK
ncbi:hypothetical protein BaRGS_00007568 [Batillaria attramentaria]|uniref:ATP-dependent RNA helicase n=1 Tax=Batillaria attramentaria TaxID=370345 RepID=A0ABD0LNM1_9CAEN